MSEDDTAASTSKAPISRSRAASGFSADERAAMREHAREVKAARGKQDSETETLAKIAEMTNSDRVIAERVHVIVKGCAPQLTPKTWYGMPAYALDGQIVCFLQCAQKFKTRYATLGFSDKAALDDGEMWPTSYALMAITPAVEASIRALVDKAVRTIANS